MKQRSLWLAVLLLLLAGLMMACTPSAATEEPEETDEVATEEVEATEEADETEEAAATEEATEPAAEAVTISVWHGYIETEEEVFMDFVTGFQERHPEITVEVLAVPFEELQNKFQTEVAAGGGPTLIHGPQDRMAAYNEAGLLAEIPADAAFFGDLVPAAVEGGKIDGVQVGVPINNKVVALYYNKSMVETPPATFEALLEDAAAGNGIAITADWFHNYMWVPAFGGQLFDDTYTCSLNTEEAAAAFQFLADTCASAGVTCDGDDGNMDTLFRQGEVAYRIQGPWASGDFMNDLGAENVGVTRVPPIEAAGDPRPWNQSEVVSISATATDEQKEAALTYLAELVSADAQAEFLNRANWIPANASVDTASNPVVGGFLEQVPFSDPFPVVAELGATWEPMGNAVNQVLEGVADPATALADACTLINTTNGK